MLVRIYRIKPVTLPILQEYNGCTSWVPLAQEVPLERPEPVLLDAEYTRQVSQVLSALGVVAAR